MTVPRNILIRQPPDRAAQIISGFRCGEVGRRHPLRLKGAVVSMLVKSGVYSIDVKDAYGVFRFVHVRGTCARHCPRNDREPGKLLHRPFLIAHSCREPLQRACRIRETTQLKIVSQIFVKASCAFLVRQHQSRDGLRFVCFRVVGAIEPDLTLYHVDDLRAAKVALEDILYLPRENERAHGFPVRQRARKIIASIRSRMPDSFAQAMIDSKRSESLSLSPRFA